MKLYEKGWTWGDQWKAVEIIQVGMMATHSGTFGKGHVKW
jgi:hypothetical protein